MAVGFSMCAGVNEAVWTTTLDLSTAHGRRACLRWGQASPWSAAATLVLADASIRSSFLVVVFAAQLPRCAGAHSRLTGRGYQAPRPL
eukprot:3811538-Rhodomonas_salina.5